MPEQNVGAISFACAVLSEDFIGRRLSADNRERLRLSIEAGQMPCLAVADALAAVLRDWARSQRAVGFLHYVQPLYPAEIREAALFSVRGEPSDLMELTGETLIMRRTPAPRYPSPGVSSSGFLFGRSLWDFRSRIFISEAFGNRLLFIPAQLLDMDNGALDDRTPLLRSVDALNTAAVRLLHIISRRDVPRFSLHAGITVRFSIALAGGLPAGALQRRVFVSELAQCLSALGVVMRTLRRVDAFRFEIGLESADILSAHNALLNFFDTLYRSAEAAGLQVCVPEANASGGVLSMPSEFFFMAGSINTLAQPDDRVSRLWFLTMVCMFLRAADIYAPLLRYASAYNGGIGGEGQPPAIVSVNLGAELTELLLRLAELPESRSARRRRISELLDSFTEVFRPSLESLTSPIAFTGNGFEFRMLPAGRLAARLGFVMNTILADSAEFLISRLIDAEDPECALLEALGGIVREHGRIVFNGNAYTELWVKEAFERGLPNIASAEDALSQIVTDASVELFERFSVLSRAELELRKTVEQLPRMML